MSGITLFEKPIEEDPSITYFPEGNRIVGFGGTKPDEGQDPYWGGRNIAESEEYNSETKRVKHVWDFKTNQALGTISCVGLIDGRQGNYYGDSLWNPNWSSRLDVSSYFSNDQKRQMVEWHDENYVCIMNDTGKVHINTYQFDFNQIGLNEKIGHNTLLSSVEVTMPKALSYATCIWKSNDTHYYGLMPFYYNNFASTTYTSKYVNNEYFWRTYNYIHLIKIDKTTLEVTSQDLTFSKQVMPNNGFLVTNKYIILPFTSEYCYNGNFYYSNNRANYNGISKTKAYYIDLETFVITEKQFLDIEGNSYKLVEGNTGNGSYLATYGMYNGGFQAVTLPNKTYMLNNLILNDDGYVIRATAGPMMNVHSNAMAPNTSSPSGYHLYVQTCPFYLGQCYYGLHNYQDIYCYHTNNIILNKEKSIIIWIGANYEVNTYSQNTSHPNKEKLSMYIIPLYSQKLMTINNLETPIEKTSDKTMKITYILTEVDENSEE